MKRILDLIICLTLVLLLFVPLILIMVLIKLKLGSPVLFTQIRPGLKSNPFKMVKFRTMTNEIDAVGALLPDAMRLTTFGKWLRASSLDELPEIWNVIKGDMSLVGPRPLLMEYLPLYTTEQARRHDVQPGITGWAQINGRNAIQWEERFKLDVWYVDNKNIYLDIKILWLTIKRVIARDGINASGEATMKKFKGT